MTPQTNTPSLVKALGSGVTTPRAFFDDDDYLDYIDECRRHWHANQPKTNYRAKEWIEMYPELKKDFQRILLDKELEKELLVEKIKNKIKIASKAKGIWYDILIELIRIKDGSKLNNLDREIRWFRLGLIDQKVNENSLTDDQIQQARDFPVEDLMDTPMIRKMWCCPFHEEKTPSFHIWKDNGWHCFGCQAHGHGAIDFLLKKDKNMKFVDAVRYLLGK